MNKKIKLGIAAALLTLSSCKKEDETTVTTIKDEVLETQNTYDDQAAQTFLQENYLDAKGNIKAFSSTDTSDDGYTKLADMNPVKLPSGVIYIVRPGAQPAPGAAIGASDKISIMQRTNTYLATNESGKVMFRSGYTFRNTIDGASAVPEEDPVYYYAKDNLLTASGKNRSYFEIEGFQEALKYFKSFNLPNSADYNLQGVIIVPSRAAFARDEYYSPLASYSLRNRSFVFNFQIYRTATR